MKIQLKHKLTQKVIIEGEYESIKDLLEQNKGANLRGADLRGADLWEANLWEAKIEITQKDEIIECLGIKVTE